MADESGWIPNDRKTETEVELYYKKIHEGETSKDRRSTRQENMEVGSWWTLLAKSRPFDRRIETEVE